MKKNLAKNNQETFVERVSKLWPVAKGSLAEVMKPCIRESCQACANGEGHAAVIFSYKDGDKRRCMYVPKELVATLRKALENGRELERLLSESGAKVILDYREQRDGSRALEKGESKD